MIQGKQLSLLLLLIMGGLVLLSAHIRKKTPDCKPIKKDQTIYTQIQEQYDPMIKLIDTIDHPISKQEFKKQIMLYNDAYNKKKNKTLFGALYQDLPFMQCKNLLDKHMKKLQRYLRKLRKKRNNKEYNRREYEIQTLIVQLEQLNRTIIISEEYRQEKLKRAGQKISGPWGILTLGFGSLIRKFIPI